MMAVRMITALMVGGLAFLVFVALLVTAVKKPRFFLGMCGLLGVVVFLVITANGFFARTIGGDAARAAHFAQNSPNELETDFIEVSTSPPDWIDAGESREGDTVIHVVEGELYATPQQANRQALAKAADRAREHLAQSVGNQVHGWNVPVDFVHDAMIHGQYVEAVERDYGTMYRSHLLMKLTPGHRDHLEARWRHEVVHKRIWSAGGVLSLVVLLLGTVAGYLKLDDATRGYYSGRLKLAALAVATGGATAVVAVVRSAVG